MHKQLSVLMVVAMLLLLAACGEDDHGGSTTAAERPPASETTSKSPRDGDERTAAEKARAKAKAKAITEAKDRRASSGASDAPAKDQGMNDTAPVQQLSDEEVLKRLEKLGYRNRALTPSELVEHCKGTAKSARKLSDSERQRLVGLCAEAASGARAEIKAAAVEVCRAAVESELPKEGPLFEVALKACEKTGDAPS